MNLQIKFEKVSHKNVQPSSVAFNFSFQIYSIYFQPNKNTVAKMLTKKSYIKSLSFINFFFPGIRSIQSVKDIISYCGGDNSSGFKWSMLSSADFSYNALTTIDCSLEFTPSLQYLNLSHNQIVSVDAIKWLPNLKVVNLGFNRLVYIPTFHIEATRRLQTLILTNNFIEDISGLFFFYNRFECHDVSGQCCCAKPG